METLCVPGWKSGRVFDTHSSSVEKSEDQKEAGGMKGRAVPTWVAERNAGDGAQIDALSIRCPMQLGFKRKQEGGIIEQLQQHPHTHTQITPLQLLLYPVMVMMMMASLNRTVGTVWGQQKLSWCKDALEKEQWNQRKSKRAEQRWTERELESFGNEMLKSWRSRQATSVRNQKGEIDKSFLMMVKPGGRICHPTPCEAQR